MSVAEAAPGAGPSTWRSLDTTGWPDDLTGQPRTTQRSPSTEFPSSTSSSMVTWLTPLTITFMSPALK